MSDWIKWDGKGKFPSSELDYEYRTKFHEFMNSDGFYFRYGPKMNWRWSDSLADVIEYREKH